MLVDESLWTAYLTAQDNLVAALLSAASAGPHILSLSGHHREGLKSSKQAVLNELSRSIERIDDAQAKMHRTLRTARAKLAGSLAPVEGLPIELVQSIIELIVTSPSQTNRIEWVCDISRQWRLAVNALPHLFVQADWGVWTLGKIRNWSALAGSRPLSVMIEDREDPSRGDMYMPDDDFQICPRWKLAKKTTFTERCRLAAELSPNFGDLCLRTCVLSSEMVAEGLIPLLASPMPRLSTLFLFSGQAQEIEVSEANIPNLKTFHFRGIQPSSLGPLGNFDNVGIGLNPDIIDKAFGAIRSTDSPNHLTLYRHPGRARSEVTSFPAQSFDQLRSIRFHGFMWDDQPVLRGLMQSLELPMLTSIEISSSSSFLISILPSTLESQIKSLTFNDATADLHWLSAFASQDAFNFEGDPVNLHENGKLPNLQELILKAPEYFYKPPSWKIHLGDRHTERLKSFVEGRKGRLKRLSLMRPLPDDVREYLIQAGDLEEICVSPSFKLRAQSYIPIDHPPYFDED
ncbi:hypothetical protein DL93DRAFT_2163825 [Clavulina sp. PMI_390]|nr:hypothetical protein DL93DRAFT_2163825 [Clavulina sp. PMI_390]